MLYRVDEPLSMKTLVVLGLVVAWAWIGVQAPSPRPSVESNRKADEITNNAQGNKPGPTPTPSAVPTVPANGNQNQTGGPQADNDKGAISAQAITINSDREHPIWGTTVKDGWDKALVIGTIALVFVGACGIRYAVKTLRVIDRQADLMDKQLASTFRAYLILGEPVDLGDKIEASFPIENVGQVAGRITSVDIEIIIRRHSDGQDIYRRSTRKNANELIAQGKDSASHLLVMLPRQPGLDETFVFGGTICYEAGFKITDTLKFVRVYKGHRHEWVPGWGYFSVDFGETPSEQQQAQNPN